MVFVFCETFWMDDNVVNVTDYKAMALVEQAGYIQLERLCGVLPVEWHLGLLKEVQWCYNCRMMCGARHNLDLV